jgi:hypothetical protein
MNPPTQPASPQPLTYADIVAAVVEGNEITRKNREAKCVSELNTLLQHGRATRQMPVAEK